MRGAFNPLVLLGLGAYPIYRAAVRVTENFFFKVSLHFVPCLLHSSLF
jgi:hypothetical protein